MSALAPEQIEMLTARALEARQWAYAPYSNYAVGAALLAASGRVYLGVNTENAAYPLTMCAERAALFAAIAEGERHFVAVAVVTRNAGSPCGACRQTLAEFGLDTEVILADDSGTVRHHTTLAALLPRAFGPADLPAP